MEEAVAFRPPGRGAAAQPEAPLACSPCCQHPKRVLSERLVASPSHTAARVLQNAEVPSSLDSASVRIIKPFPAAQPTSRHQPLQPIVAAPAAATAPKQDHQRMDTIQEDPSTDSHIDEDGFEKDPFPNSSSAAKSFEDLTEHPVTRSEKASSFKLQRQNRVDSKETEC